MTPDTLRIVQITDIHLTEREGEVLHGVDTGRSLHRVLTAISNLSPKPALIIASGDLVQMANAESYRHLKAIFDAFNLPVYVLPGNHDEPDIMRLNLVGDKVNYQSRVEVGGWSIVFIDSTIREKHHGFVSDNEQAQLEEYIGSASNEPGLSRPVLIALHHPTINSCPSFACRLDNGDQFIHYLKQQPSIKAVIAGHTHLAAETIEADLAQYTTPSTFAQITHSDSADPTGEENFWISHTMDSSRHGYRVLDLSHDGSIHSFIGWVNNANKP